MNIPMAMSFGSGSGSGSSGSGSGSGSSGSGGTQGVSPPSATARIFDGVDVPAGVELLYDGVCTNATASANPSYTSGNNWYSVSSYAGAAVDTGIKPMNGLFFDLYFEYNRMVNGWDSVIGVGSSGVWNDNLLAVFPKWDQANNMCAMVNYESGRYAQNGSYKFTSFPTGVVCVSVGWGLVSDGQNYGGYFKVYDASGDSDRLLYSEGVSRNAFASDSSSGAYNIWLGGCNYNGARLVNPMDGRIFRCSVTYRMGSIYQRLLGSFFSARVDGVCGFYDVIGQKFHPSVTSTPFTAYGE